MYIEVETILKITTLKSNTQSEKYLWTYASGLNAYTDKHDVKDWSELNKIQLQNKNVL